MKTEHIVIAVLALMVLGRRQPTVKERLNDPAVWGADMQGDMWEALYGENLRKATGQHSAPSGYDAYGVQGGLGFPGYGAVPEGFSLAMEVH
jgi:hypothetical protein